MNQEHVQRKQKKYLVFIPRNYKKPSLKTNKYSINHFEVRKKAWDYTFSKKRSHMQWAKIWYKGNIFSIDKTVWKWNVDVFL